MRGRGWILEVQLNLGGARADIKVDLRVHSLARAQLAEVPLVLRLNSGHAW